MRWCQSVVTLLLGVLPAAIAESQNNNADDCDARTQHIPDPPYQNYFYSDCHVDAQAVVTSPLPDSDLTVIGPRFIVAWPAGNSGIATVFKQQNGQNGSLAIELVNSTLGNPLKSVVRKNCSPKKNPSVGVEGVLSFNSSTELSLAILGSVRTIRDYTEGGGSLQPIFQDALKFSKYKQGGVKITRRWLDNVTTTTFTLEPWKDSKNRIEIDNKTLKFGSGQYRFSAAFNYPQLKQLSPSQILNPESQGLITERAEEVSSLSFFSYTDKLLAGGWRFLTYFGRDSMISALLLQSVLSYGEGSAMEAVIGAALERVNKTDGSVCHEETIGDYATYLNLQKGIDSSAAGCVYPMIDTDYYLPILMARYFASSPDRVKPLLGKQAGSVDEENKGLSWGDLGFITAQKIMKITAAFEQEQTVKNLIHLKDGEGVGQWRDSGYGIANGRTPFDVNTALVPAALKAISELAAIDGVFPKNSESSNWASQAAKRAKVWEDKTLQFFQFNTTAETATSRVQDFITKNTYYKGPTHADAFATYSGGGNVVDYALAIKSTDSPDAIPISHTDTAFRNFLLNSTNDEQLTTFINATANAVLRPFPAGLTTPIGVVVANPALSDNDDYISGFSNAAYHGTVIWSWQLALMARGFELQLDRCSAESGSKPAFCADKNVYGALLGAYNRLWDVITDNKSQLQSEVWSWTYNTTGNGEGQYHFTPLGALAGGTESDVRQLWSLTFLAIEKNPKFAE